jgi:hypothetical protein
MEPASTHTKPRRKTASSKYLELILFEEFSLQLSLMQQLLNSLGQFLVAAHPLSRKTMSISVDALKLFALLSRA